MKLAICSDLHLEFADIHLQNEGADVLILSGDILIAQDLYDNQYIPANPLVPLTFGQERALRFRNFLKRVSADFPAVVYVAGNHEFYHGRWPFGYNYLAQECANYSNIYFLEMSSIELHGWTFLGATFWTNMNNRDDVTLNLAGAMMNDYRQVKVPNEGYRKLRPMDTIHRHDQSLKYLADTISAAPDKNYIVVGHHAPSKASVHPRYASDKELNACYSSDLNDFILAHPQIRLWTHGHTHDEFDYQVGSTQIICNPRGYDSYEQRAADFNLRFVDIN